MKEIEAGARIALRSKVTRRIIHGFRVVLRAYWYTFGLLDPYIVTGGYLLTLGMVQSFILLQYPTLVLGISGFLPEKAHQLLFAYSLVFVGWLLSATRRQEVLFLAVMMNFFYAFSTIQAISTTTVSVVAWTAVIYITWGTVAISAYASTKSENNYLRKRLQSIEEKQNKLDSIVMNAERKVQQFERHSYEV